MVGDTNTTVDQTTDAESGPARSGSQIVGVIQTPEPESGSGGGAGAGTTTPGGSSDSSHKGTGSGGSFNNVQTPAPAAEGGVHVKMFRRTSDAAATGVVVLVMLLGTVFGIRKLPAPTP